MKMFLIRHGTAEPLSPGVADTERPLSALGQAEATRLANYLAATGNRFTHVWSSPLTRARQTAQQIIKATRSVEIKISQTLAPEVEPVMLANWLRELTNDDLDSVALVGHQPSLGRAISLLLRARDDLMSIVPATLVELSFLKEEREHGVRLTSLIRPDCLAAAAASNSNLRRS
jgi:phosphohistidine phosphatase SixA